MNVISLKNTEKTLKTHDDGFFYKARFTRQLTYLGFMEKSLLKTDAKEKMSITENKWLSRLWFFFWKR